MNDLRRGSNAQATGLRGAAQSGRECKKAHSHQNLVIWLARRRTQRFENLAGRVGSRFGKATIPRDFWRPDLPPRSALTDLAPPFEQRGTLGLGAAQAELHAALLAPLCSVAPKYFYDTLGSRLFDAITALPEYYPTRTEASIVQTHATDIAKAVGTGTTLIDLGAGNCAKGAALFEALSPRAYWAVDISADFLKEALARLKGLFPRIAMEGIGTDFSQGLALPEALADERRVLFYAGSSIGNFTPRDATTFLAGLAPQVRGGGLLIGVDWRKAEPTMVAAYDDSLGVTAAFNRNVLLNINRILSSNFAPQDWEHVALFNAQHSRIEMHLEARRAVHVAWPGGERRFAQGERIHTENSYKYTAEAFNALLRDAGFTPAKHWTDAGEQFGVVWATA